MKKYKKLCALLVVFAMVFGLTTVSDTVAAKKKAPKVTVKKVSANAPYAKTAYIAKGKSVKLSAKVTVSPNKSANKKVTFKSSKKKIATVSSQGVVKAKKVGTAKITIASKMNKKKKATITVKVMKNPVTKVSLNKKSTTLNVGSKLALKAKVSAKKGASKRVYWTSSKTKVAIVSQKGVVTAKGVGTANITVTATDGSKKKATCKVRVAAPVVDTGDPVHPAGPVNITGMNITGFTGYYNNTITFSLNRPCKLDMSQIIVKRKKMKSGSYQHVMEVKSLTTPDYVNYTLFLNKVMLVEGDTVQLSIPTLTGTVKVMEKEYLEVPCAYTKESVAVGAVGCEMNEKFMFYESNSYSSYSITGLPDGLKYFTEGDSYSPVVVLVVKGKPKTAGRYTATMTAIDETGNTLTEQIIFCIGSENEIAAGVVSQYVTIAGNAADVSCNITAVGGSGNYTYSIADNPQGFTMSENKVKGTLTAAGTYQFEVTVADEDGSGLQTKVPLFVYAARAFRVTGTVTDAEGKPFPDAEVYFVNKDKNSKYIESKTTYTCTDTNTIGTYDTVLTEGTYDIQVQCHSGAEYHLDNQVIAGDTTIPTITLPVYKVTPVMQKETNGPSGMGAPDSWYDENGDFVGYTDTLYLSNGTYTLYSERLQDSYGKWGLTCYYQITFTVNGVAVETAVTMADTVQALVTPISLGTFTTTCDKNYRYYTFTPTETGTYSFESSGSISGVDPYLSVYYSNGKYSSDDDSGVDKNFKFVSELKQGLTYCFRIDNITYPDYARPGKIQVTLSKVEA